LEGRDELSAGGVSVSWLNLETDLTEQGFHHICGVDEAGRGPLAGPVVAACVVLPAGIALPGLNDSKKISAIQRERLYKILISEADFAVGLSTVEEIDSINIRQASFLAMLRAVEAMKYQPDYLLVDGWEIPSWQGPQNGIIKGDAQVRSIAAASVIAKVTRDQIMVKAADDFPQYGFARHKGYPTRMHYAMLKEYGPSSFHRHTFLRNLQLRLGEE